MKLPEKIFAQRLKIIMKEKNYTQAILAEMLDVDIATIANWAIGRRTPQNHELLTRISKIFNVTLDWLIGATNYRSRLLEDGEVVIRYRGGLEVRIDDLPDEDQKMIWNMIDAIKKRHETEKINIKETKD